MISFVRFKSEYFLCNRKIKLNHQIKRSRDDCKLDGLKFGEDSFGIKCCPGWTFDMFLNRRECVWLGGASGQNVKCEGGKAAFGRCSTSQRSANGGDCNNVLDFKLCS